VVRVNRDTLAAHMSDPEWIAFADATYTGESVRFLQDVAVWKTWFHDKGANWAHVKARALVRLYCREHSPLQINISGKARTRLLNAVDAPGNVSYEVFDEAALEVTGMLLNGPFMGFMRRRHLGQL